MIEVEPSERVHENRKGEVFLRVGDENRRLGLLEAQELHYDKGDSIHDGTAAGGVQIEDLDEGLVRRFVEAVQATSRRPEPVLLARGLLINSNRAVRPTIAGTLVLGREPQRIFPQASVRVVSYHGTSRETGARMFQEMQRVGLPDPIYRQGPASVRVALLADALSRRVLERLPLGSERFVEHLSRQGPVTTTEAMDLFDVSRPTTLRYLHGLAGAGLIEHVGTSLKDPRGYWRLKRGGGAI